jgi:hypothetical protein
VDRPVRADGELHRAHGVRRVARRRDDAGLPRRARGPLSVGVFALVSVTKLIVVCCSTVARTNSKRALSVDCGAAPSRRPPGKSEWFVPSVTMLVLSFAKTSAGGQVVDLSTLIRRESPLDDHSPPPPASCPPLPLQRPSPARPREPRPASAARRVQDSPDIERTSSRAQRFQIWVMSPFQIDTRANAPQRPVN